MRCLSRAKPGLEVASWGEGISGVVSVGEVADQPSDFFGDLRPSFGGGIRFKLKKDSPTLLRLDVGIGTEGNRGFYFAVNEAF